jgi:PTS system ascorbate-specific IIB component
VIKVFAVCGMGLGTSVILKSRLKEALEKEGVDYQLDVTDAGSASGSGADLIFTSDELADRIKDPKAKIVIIDNFTDREEVGRKVAEALKDLD